VHRAAVRAGRRSSDPVRQVSFTTAIIALQFAIAGLSQSPEAEARLLAEVDAFCMEGRRRRRFDA